MVNINIKIPDEIHKEAKIKSIKLGMDLKDYIINAIVKKNQEAEKE